MGWDVLATERHCYILLEFSVWKLPKIRRLRGPDIFSGERVAEFRKKYSKAGKVWVEGEYWFAEVKREFTDAEDKTREFLRGRKGELREKGIPSHIAAAIRGYGIMSGASVTRAAKDREFALFLRGYFEREMI